MKCASCVGTTRFQCGKDAWRLLTAWLAGTQMKSPGVQLCRGIGRGSSTLYAGDPLSGHRIDSAGMVILSLKSLAA